MQLKGYSPLQRGEVPLYSSLCRFPIIPVTLHRCQHRGGRVNYTNQRSAFMLVVIIDVGTNHGILLILDYTLNCNLFIVGEMILILTNQAVFVTLSVVTIPPLVQCIFILTLNQADVIRDLSDAVTQNAWFRCVLCAAISGEISILIQTGAETWGRFPVPRICHVESTKGVALT